MFELIANIIMGVSKSGGGGNGGDLKKIMSNTQKLLGHNQTIAGMAKQAINEIPVIISSGFIDNKDMALKLVKYSEYSYAYFYMISVGLNPVVGGGGEIESHLGKYGGEDFKAAYGREDVSDDMKKACEIFLRDYFNKEYQSVEAVTPNTNTGTSGDSKGRGDDSRSNGNNKDKSSNTNDNTFPENGHRAGDGAANKQVFWNTIGKTNPTIIPVTLYIKGQTNAITVNIGIKACPHFIEPIESEMLLENMMEGRQKIFRNLQLRSGEIKFFKDYLLQLGKIKKNQHLYNALGSHPWYMRLMKNKSKNFLKAIADFCLEGILSSKEVLPIANLIVTSEEMTHALKIPYKRIAYNHTLVTKLMKDMFLLALIVVDTDSGLVYVHFNGLSNTILLGPKDLDFGGGSGGGGNDEVMNALVGLMSKMVGRGY